MGAARSMSDRASSPPTRGFAARRGAQAAPSFFFLGAFRGAIVCFFRPLTGAGAGFFRGAAGFLEGAGAGAANRTADEEILDVALAAKKEGATVLCTRDTAWKATDGAGTPPRTQIDFRTGATRTCDCARPTPASTR